jgi:hypothetical protein
MHSIGHAHVQPAEQERFQQVGVTPPDYTVTLKIQATPAP